MADSGIYQIRNFRNGKLYIGSARDLKQRRATHFKLLGENRHHCRHLQAAWNKYGAEAFVFELVEHVGHVDRLIPREQHYIDTRQPEYNTCRIRSEEHTSELQSLMRISYAVFCLKKKTKQ